MKTDPLAQLRTGAPLTTRQQMSLTLQLSWPAIMAQLATIIMQYIDAAMVGRLGATQSAAVGLVASTTWLFGGLSYAAAMGFNVLTAQRVGGGRLAEARNILKQALVLCLAFSVVMAALAAALSAPLPRMLRADRDIWQDASAYFLVYSLFLPALQLDNVAAGQLQATGNMRTPGICMVVMCALDIVFNTLFIFPSGTVRLGSLALPGAGLGTRINDHRGRALEKVGAHCRNHNSHSIGVCYEGGLDADGKPKDTRTMEQRGSLLALLRELRRQFPKALIVGHRDLNPMKGCPCFECMKEYRDL